MNIRYPLTVLTVSALLMASGLSFAGGMPSDEGPEVILEDLGFNDDASLDEDTITAIIKIQPFEPLVKPALPVAYVVTAAVNEIPEATLPRETYIWPVPNRRDDDWQSQNR